MKKERTSILSAASALFVSKGIRNVSVEDIMRSCGMSKKTFYLHFESKEKLIHAIVHNWVEKSERYLSLNSYISSNAISEMNNFFQSMIKVVQTIQPLFFHELRKYYADSWQQLEKFREDSLVPFLVLNISRGLTEEIYRGNINSTLAGKIYFAHLEIALEDIWIAGVAPHSILREMNTFLLHGLVNLKGMKLIYEKPMA